MTFRSDKAPIYHMYARVAFKKRKVVHERTMWVVSVFETPGDIMSYDSKTMSRLKDTIYGPNSKSDKEIIIREIFDTQFISYSNHTIDEHKRKDQKTLQDS